MTDRSLRMLRWTLASLAAMTGLIAAACSTSSSQTARGTPAPEQAARSPLAPARESIPRGGVALTDALTESVRRRAPGAGRPLGDRDGSGFGVAQDPAPAAAEPPAELVLQPGQELWIIERPPQADRYAPRPADDEPGTGCMRGWTCIAQDASCEVAVPLEHTDVRARIAGPIASTRVTQRFVNPYSSKIEAVYVFPLPDDASVNDFVMTVAGRSIRGVIREREQAERIYAEARAQGHTASLMTQERSNIFTQKVANIAPGERVDVTITYFGTLGYREGGYEFVFPMVVGPRYNPPSTVRGEPAGQGTGIGAAPAGAYGASGQAVQQQYLRPGQRSGQDIAIAVDIAAGVRIEGLESPTHQVAVSVDPADPTRARVELAPQDRIPNRDFVLRCRVAGGGVKGGVLTTTDASGGYLAMLLVPPGDLRYTARGPVEMIFVVDCSGSMSGAPVDLAKRSVLAALDRLRAGDTFQIVRFANTATFLSPRPVRANPENLDEARRQVAALATGGGTELLRGLEPALEFRADSERTRFVCILSDGLLGNEPEVLKSLRGKLGDSRVFTVGIGSAPNRTLMNAMARLGRGCAGYVATERDASDVMGLFMERVSAAAMTDLRVDWGDLNVSDVQPARLPDLYVGRPVLVTARFKGPAPIPAGIASSQVRVTGRAGGERQTVNVPVLGDPGGETARALPLVWARAKMTDLDEDAGWFGLPGAGSTRGANKAAIRDLALQYGLLSAYTGFVAVDAASRPQGTYGTTVQVPSNVPQGVRYETTVGER